MLLYSLNLPHFSDRLSISVLFSKKAIKQVELVSATFPL